MQQIKTVLLCRDAQLREKLKSQLCFYRNLELVADFDSAEAASAFIQAHRVDAVFSEFDQNSSSLFVSSLCMTKPDIMIILFDENASVAYDALRNGAIDFLKLPLEATELQRVIQKISTIRQLYDMCNGFDDHRLIVKTDDGYKVVMVYDIMYVERVDRKINIVCREDMCITVSGYTMADMEQYLSASKFYRCSKSIIVNLDNVDAVNVDHRSNYCSLKLTGYDMEIPVSRQKKNEIIEHLKERYFSTKI